MDLQQWKIFLWTQYGRSLNGYYGLSLSRTGSVWIYFGWKLLYGFTTIRRNFYMDLFVGSFYMDLALWIYPSPRKPEYVFTLDGDFYMDLNYGKKLLYGFSDMVTPQKTQTPLRKLRPETN